MPTSQEFHLIPVSDIKVPEGRHRKKFDDIEALALSISRVGLIHPVVVKRDGTLIVGERRLRAVQLLEHTEIPAQYFDELSPEEARLVELEENLKRQDLTWQEDCLAHLEFHEGQRRLNGEAWGTELSAEYLGCGVRALQRRLEIAQVLAAGRHRIQECDSLGAAYTLLSRERGRAIGDELQTLDNAIRAEVGAAGGAQGAAAAGDSEGHPGIPPPPWERNPIRPAEEDIICADFRTWAKDYSGDPFNLLHVDFPYGVRQDRSDQAAASSWDTYEDSPDTYWELVSCLLDNDHKIVAPSAHIMFWFSMNHYETTARVFNAAGYRINPRPLIWMKSDNVGIVPDALRGPRQIYETAFLITRGDRKIVAPVSDAVARPGSRREARHQSEKTWTVCAHFLRMLVDEHTTMLDPTCGCGNALAVGWRLGATRVFGMDLNQDNVDSSCKILRQTRMSMAGETEDEAKEYVDEAYPIEEPSPVKLKLSF